MTMQHRSTQSSTNDAQRRVANLCNVFGRFARCISTAEFVLELSVLTLTPFFKNFKECESVVS